MMLFDVIIAYCILAEVLDTRKDTRERKVDVTTRYRVVVVVVVFVCFILKQ